MVVKEELKGRRREEEGGRTVMGRRVGLGEGMVEYLRDFWTL